MLETATARWTRPDFSPLSLLTPGSATSRVGSRKTAPSPMIETQKVIATLRFGRWIPAYAGMTLRADLAAPGCGGEQGTQRVDVDGLREVVGEARLLGALAVFVGAPSRE